MARERVEHGALFIAAAAVEKRVKLGVLPEKEALQSYDGIFELAAALRLRAVQGLQLLQLFAEGVVLRLQGVDDRVFVLERCLELAKHAHIVRISETGIPLWNGHSGWMVCEAGGRT